MDRECSRGYATGSCIRKMLASDSEPYRIEGAVLQAWQLSISYLELLLLRRLDYRGMYLPRYPPGGWSHDSQRVPWA